MSFFTINESKRVNLDPCLRVAKLFWCWAWFVWLEFHDCNRLGLIFWQLLKVQVTDEYTFLQHLLRELEIFTFPKSHYCCFCPGIKSFEWIGASSEQHVSTNWVFLRQRWSLYPQTSLFIWAKEVFCERMTGWHIFINVSHTVWQNLVE